ncbi:acetyl-CoA carboxylase biotin carboxylase subunit [Chondromyces apiculatus]|uniref:Methylcrotonyl-CoA carboxylase biotin-containing subunit n=1 Tax=Chondromyces apiculatus DSM 436 TaxID=1192034 RepID=A0A017T2B1_9BACT|nr:biotin carboxylase N-terminal domain-containing protein [Chondromyces apiculatus]EYF03404.1 Methylcrotonyl-CoA carboxylase biotin-containing subunit [Chondromyces apiculatus DSM 436]
MLRKILVANRGEIACRILRTCKRLGIATVAIYSDADAQAPHVAMADTAVRVGPPPVKDSYLNIEAIVDAARTTGADAVHPGYGLLSEKKAFADAVAAAGITYIGPPPAVLDAFGDKITARAVAAAAGVSPPPGTQGAIDPAEVDTITREAERIGYPLLVKAAGGGGGIGMQIVTDPQKLARAVQACSDRGRQAFADPRVYLERYIEKPRHIEVQVLCDGQGGAVALGERECSVQRRHQKIIEETPSPAAFFQGAEGEARREKLLADALRVVTSVGYVGAGTVEFVASQTGELWFLEVNARLQVEHCVTEMVTGIDLVEQQIRVASGERLAPEILAPTRRGASIEARIYAEDPAKKFAPQPGRITRLAWPAAGDDLRIETGVAEGLDVTPFYDPMLAKVVAWGETREAAVNRLDAALAATTLDILGPVGPAATNRSFLRKVLASDPFLAGQYDTALAEALAKG